MPATLTPDQVQFVEQCRVARLGTVDRQGEAFLVPVCYAFTGEYFVTPIDEKPKRSDRPLKRVRNIQESGRATLLFDHYEDADWSRLVWMMVRGPAEVIDPDDLRHPGAVDALRTRYPQYREMNLETAQMILIHPEHVTGWGAFTGSA